MKREGLRSSVGGDRRIETMGRGDAEFCLPGRSAWTFDRLP
jgi:hypothetical protein